jgi:hypothetical protein
MMMVYNSILTGMLNTVYLANIFLIIIAETDFISLFR